MRLWSRNLDRLAWDWKRVLGGQGGDGGVMGGLSDHTLVGVGSICAACGFRYLEHNGHLIPCPKCEMDRLRAKYESPNPQCNKGHVNNLPLALWDCPMCVTELRKWMSATEHPTTCGYVNGPKPPCTCGAHARLAELHAEAARAIRARREGQ